MTDKEALMKMVECIPVTPPCNSLERAEGFGDGQECENSRLLPIITALIEDRERLREGLNKVNHAVANAWEWQVSDPEDSELDRDQQIGSWCEKACDEIKLALARSDEDIKKLLEG